MAGFDFTQLEQFVPKQTNNPNRENKIEFLALKDDGWYAELRFMYGPGEIFRGETVHNTAEQGQLPKYVPCLRQLGDPVDVCPLCAAGKRVQCQYFIPVFVEKLTTVINGVEQTQEIKKSMLFQRGATFQAQLKSVIRQAGNRPLVNCVFRVVRNGATGAQGTQYTIEFVGADDTTLEQLPPRVEALGTYVLPQVSKEKMIEKYLSDNNKDVANNNGVANNTQSSITPRTISANTFAGNTVVAQPTSGYNANQYAQAPAQAPNINSGNMPF